MAQHSARAGTERERERDALESTTVGIYRTAAVVKGGRRFSFGALVVAGDRNGRVGLGYGKAPGVPAAIEKAEKEARKSLQFVRLQGSTLPHEVMAKFGASQVKLVPAAPGTGVIAGARVRAVLELAGVKDCLTKAFGSTNQKNLCKATFKGLLALRQKGQIETLRGVTIDKTDVEQRLELGQKYAATVVTTEKAAAKPAKNEKRDGQDRPRRGKPQGRSKGPQKAEAKQRHDQTPPTPGSAPAPEGTPQSAPPQVTPQPAADEKAEQ